jgi:hydroxymethylpyrimidine/phosphomethylpyrimidine kinase
MNPEVKKQPVCLSIAGLDPSGGAGIIADIKAFRAFGCFGTAAVTSITFQNTQGVFGAVHQTAESVRGQIRPVLDDMPIAAVKTGMLPTGDVISETARSIAENKLKNIIVDPVVRSTSGFDLIDDRALRSLIDELFPLADLVTPNIPEAERIAGIAIHTESDLADAAAVMRAMGATNILIKGGHFGEKRGVGRIARDFLFVGETLHYLDGEYFETTATHGTGCTLAAAIAANLAIGNDLAEAVLIAKRFVAEAIRTAPNLGRGHSPINI